MRPFFVFFLFAAIAGQAVAGPIDEALTAAEPCKVLPEFDTTESIRIERADLSLRREVFSLRAEGFIDCRTRGSGFSGGNLTARVTITGTVDSRTCEPTEVDISFANIGGSSGAIWATQKEATEENLSSVISAALKAECQRGLADFLD